MKYNFDNLKDRRATNSIKWDVKDGELPLWVADMDFECAPEIRQAVTDRCNHGVFGYADTNDDWRNSYVSWWKTRHGLEIEGDWLVFVTGIVPAISSIVRKITTPNENVVLMTPTYNIFYNSIINNGRHPLENQLVYDRDNGEYSIDFDDLESKLKDPQTSLLILCNPQNPVGKIWDRETLAKIGHLCKIHNVTVLSDEIHCDLTVPGKDYVPFISINDECRYNCIMACAPTKTFNLAGFQTAAVVVPDANLRHKVWRGINTDECGEPNCFAVEATVAAFNKGGEWLDELREYIAINRRYMEDFISKNLIGYKAVHGDATYLLWLDISSSGMDGSTFAEKLRENTGLYISGGNQYGLGGKDFVRVNLATSLDNVKDACCRLQEFVAKI